jgi:hypothetical protein
LIDYHNKTKQPTNRKKGSKEVRNKEGRTGGMKRRKEGARKEGRKKGGKEVLGRGGGKKEVNK